MKLPSLPKPPGQKRFNQAVQRRPSQLYKENYNLLPTTENPVREKLFMPTPAGVPAEPQSHVPKVPKAPTGNVRAHWSNH
jgi:hypothetical protein